jgi:hypothetical protein
MFSRLKDSIPIFIFHIEVDKLEIVDRRVLPLGAIVLPNNDGDRTTWATLAIEDGRCHSCTRSSVEALTACYSLEFLYDRRTITTGAIALATMAMACARVDYWVTDGVVASCYFCHHCCHVAAGHCLRRHSGHHEVSIQKKSALANPGEDRNYYLFLFIFELYRTRAFGSEVPLLPIHRSVQL